MYTLGDLSAFNVTHKSKVRRGIKVKGQKIK